MARRIPLAAVLLLGLLPAAACRIERAPSGRPGAAAVAPDDSAAIDDVLVALRQYYARLTSRDVKALSRSFWPRATVTSIMRTWHDTTERVRPVPIEEVIRGGPLAPECPASLSDEMQSAAVTTYGPLADAWVIYRARCGVSRDSTATHYGVDAFHLMRRGGEWRIAGLAFTHEVAGRPLTH
jgi:hypothetical protein